jgi:flagellar hook-associated protein 2
VELLGGNARSTLFGTATSTAGLDIAGSLGTGKATGNGQQLTSDNGLTVSVSGGATGARGGVMFTRGMATKLDDLLTQLSASKGTIGGRIDSLQEGVKDIEKKREFINAQLEVKQKRYLDQFNTLDGLLSNMQSTMSYLAQQLSSLNNLK